MHSQLDRRAFLRTAASSAAAAGLLSLPSRQARAAADPKFRISLAEWSLHKTIFGKKLDHLDFAKTAKEEFGIDAVEYVNQMFFGKAQDQDYLKQMKQRASDAGVQSLLIMIDREGDLGSQDDKKRTQAIENHYKWVEAAKFLGCHSIRVNARSQGSYDEQLERAADGLRRLCEFADKHEINVIVENHGGLSSNGAWLAAVMKKVDHPRCGTLPDFGNFGEYDRYQGVKELMPYAKGVSAKSYGFNEQGNETKIDYDKMMGIVLGSGYEGYIGIEYEGGKLDEYAGIKATKQLLQRFQ